jgi:branched-chain amino acid transport system ATP-binding protein
MSSQAPLLQLENVSMHFGGLQALQNVNLQVTHNSITALIGPNGAGKTTLFNCITGFYRATGGSLFWHAADQRVCLRRLLGEPLRLADVTAPRQIIPKIHAALFGGSHQVARVGIARTFQNIRLFKQMSVIENILVAQHRFAHRNPLTGLLRTSRYRQSERAALQNAFDTLEMFSMVSDANRLAGELPYGKQRRLEIARALATRPQLLCLDEPAAGLNPAETAELIDIIRRIRDNHRITILLIEHDIRLVMQLSEAIYVLDHGEIIASGTPQAIRENPHVIAAYLGIADD